MFDALWQNGPSSVAARAKGLDETKALDGIKTWDGIKAYNMPRSTAHERDDRTRKQKTKKYPPRSTTLVRRPPR